MKKFSVEIEETSYKVIEVVAENEEEAMHLAEAAVENGEAELQDTDCYDIAYEADDNSVTPV